ncbi:DNA primase [Nocardia asteroides]|uniref:DNA primase n=1 Tax=Nocardia asteroides TaxID=1824 RepID=UPI0037C7B3D4
MAARIPDRAIAEIRDAMPIGDVVSEFVALAEAFDGALEGLCPWESGAERSLRVRPDLGVFHCSSCGQGGDVIEFLQQIEHIGFVEAVEQMADRIGYQINYEGGGTSVQRDRGTRSRLVAANAAAHEFYIAQLREPEAEAARKYLTDRNFDGAAAQQFGCGYAPGGWDVLTKHLLRKGFEFKELEAAGLSKQGKRGPIDRFHRRLLWPIRNLGGEVIGFGARKLFDDDTMPGKYVNTPETLLYKKSQVLFGLDHAKREISKGHQAVVVEGYTDVMAMHLAGVKTAVASCGTAFGEEHLQVLRRLLMDDNFWRGEIIYTFDGDAAGQAAALKAFSGDQRLAGQTYIAVAPDGQDPCELRQHSGDAAVRDLVARRTPLYEFVIRGIIEQNRDGGGLSSAMSVEQQVAAIRAAAPVVAQIKDDTTRSAWAPTLAGWVGFDDVELVEELLAEATPAAAAQPTVVLADAPACSSEIVQRQSLCVALQHPYLAREIDTIDASVFSEPRLLDVRVAIAAAGGISRASPGGSWISAVISHAPDPEVRGLITGLACEALPMAGSGQLHELAAGAVAALRQMQLARDIGEAVDAVRDANTAGHRDWLAVIADLAALEAARTPQAADRDEIAPLCEASHRHGPGNGDQLPYSL